MTSSKIALAVLALGFSFGPAFAEPGSTFSRPILSGSPVAASLVEGRQAAELPTATTDAERFVIDRNLVESRNR